MITTRLCLFLIAVIFCEKTTPTHQRNSLTSDEILHEVSRILQEKNVDLSVTFNERKYDKDGDLEKIDSLVMATTIKESNGAAMDVGNLTRDQIDKFMNLGKELNMLGLFHQMVWKNEHLINVKFVIPDYEITIGDGNVNIVINNNENIFSEFRKKFDEFDMKISSTFHNRDGMKTEESYAEHSAELVEIVSFDNFPLNWLMDVADKVQSAYDLNNSERDRFLLEYLSEKYLEYIWNVTHSNLHYSVDLYINNGPNEFKPDIYAVMKFKDTVFHVTGEKCS